MKDPPTLGRFRFTRPSLTQGFAKSNRDRTSGSKISLNLISVSVKRLQGQKINSQDLSPFQSWTDLDVCKETNLVTVWNVPEFLFAPVSSYNLDDNAVNPLTYTTSSY